MHLKSECSLLLHSQQLPLEEQPWSLDIASTQSKKCYPITPTESAKPITQWQSLTYKKGGGLY